jgi:hypothetical protein
VDDRILEGIRSLGAQLFNSPTEEEVAALREEVFKTDLPRVNTTGELTLCRTALTARNLGRLFKQSPRMYWTFMKKFGIDQILAANPGTEQEQAGWALAEERLLVAIEREV